MRIVIADDEPLVRSYVRSLIVDALSSDAEILDAVDGKELVDLVAAGKADVAFVDIRMPKMDGFAALDSLRVLGRRIPWFVLSSHSDFAYAKRAMELGASGYVLKPPSPEEIRAALATLRAAMDGERKKKSDQFEHDWTLFVVGNAAAAPDLGRGARYSVGLIVLDGETGAEKRTARAEAVARAVRERGRRFADLGLWTAAAGWGADGSVAVIAGTTDSKPAASDDPAGKRFWNETSLVAENESENGMRVRALTLVADAESDASRCKALLASLSALAGTRALLPSGTLTADHARELLKSVSSTEIERAERADKLVRSLRGGDAMGLKESVSSYLSIPGEHKAVSRFLERYLGDISAVRTEGEFLAVCESRIGVSPMHAKERDTIASVESYIRRRYAEHISVEQAADIFGLTPNYLSALFHKRTGKTFVRYATEIRLHKARDLLREGGSVKETAWKVGYGSERHFTRLYRKFFGHAPAFEKKS